MSIDVDLSPEGFTFINKSRIHLPLKIYLDVNSDKVVSIGAPPSAFDKGFREIDLFSTFTGTISDLHKNCAVSYCLHGMSAARKGERWWEMFLRQSVVIRNFEKVQADFPDKNMLTWCFSMAGARNVIFSLAKGKQEITLYDNRRRQYLAKIS